ncbi:MAG: tetratricopeptide repeat protein [Cytophagales bacterium]|nr:tetratricopeptide repeat protein [Cytophagales bacterium]
MGKKHTLCPGNLLEMDYTLNLNETKSIYKEVDNVLKNHDIFPKEHPWRLEFYGILGRYTLINEQFNGARKYQDDIIQLTAKLYGDNSPVFGKAVIRQASIILQYANDTDLADSIYTHVFDAWVKGHFHPKSPFYINTMYDYARLNEYQDDLRTSKQVYEELQRIIASKYKETDINFGIALNRLASSQLNVGDYSQAEKNIDQALDVLKRYKGEDDVLQYASALSTEAKLYAIKGMYDDASGSFRRARRMEGRAVGGALTTSQDRQAQLVDLYLTMGEYGDAQAIVDKQTSEVKEKIGEDSRLLIRPYAQAAKLKLANGDYTQAEQLAEVSIRLAKNVFGENSSWAALGYEVQRQLYLALGDYGRSATAARRQVEITQRVYGNKHVKLAHALADFGLVEFYRSQNEPLVDSLLIQAKEIVQASLGQNNPQYADMLKRLAVFYIAVKRYPEAKTALDQSMAIWSDKLGKRNVNVAELYALYGDLCYAQRQYKESEINYGKAEKLFEKFFSDRHPEYVKVVSKLSKVHYMQGDKKQAKTNIDEALENYKLFVRDFFPALSEQQKTAFWALIRPDFEYYNTLAMNLQTDYPEMIENVYNNALLTKGLLLNSSIKMRQRILSSQDSALIAQYQEWVRKKDFMAKLISLSAEKQAELDIKPAQLNDQIDALEKKLSQGSELFKQAHENTLPQWQDIQKDPERRRSGCGNAALPPL